MDGDQVCQAPLCTNKTGSVVEGIAFHRFPEDADICGKWLSALRKDNWEPTENDAICSNHFTADQFYEDNGVLLLKTDAVPSKFEILPSPKAVFPAELPARFLSVRDIECDGRKGYIIEARLPLASEEEFQEWLRSHERLAEVKYMLMRNYPSSKKLSYKADFVCFHGSAAERISSNVSCPARLLVRIRANPRFRYNRPDGFGVGYPCTVVLYHLHNHSVGQHNIEKMGPFVEEVSSTVKQKFIEMFKGGYNTETGMIAHQKDLLEEYPDEHDEMLNETSVCPSLEWLSKFYEHFADEFCWDNNKVLDILKEEIEDVNASNSCATMATVNEHVVLVLSTPLMQRSHSMKAAGEVVFVDNSGYLDRCHCYVYVLMAYSCAEGLPLGLMITTSDAEEILTAGFKLLADIMPEKGFGSFGRQGPEVFLTANNDALQNSLKAIYPDSAVMLCAYNMSHELWTWLWNPENMIEESDRCILFSLAYKIMQTKNAAEFHQLSNVIEGNSTLQKYENFKVYFDGVKSLCDRWAVLFNNEMLDKDKQISGIEMASHVLKDKVFLTKAYNILQLLKHFTDTMETYYRQKIIHCINDSLESFILSSFPQEKRETSHLVVQPTPYGQYEVKNIKKDKSYYVDMNICVCSCSLGLKGRRCKHLYAVCVAKKADFVTSVPNDEVIKRELFWIATGTMKTSGFEAQPEASGLDASVDDPASGNLPPLPVRSSSSVGDPDSIKHGKEEARKILDRVVRSIMQKYDSSPSEFHRAIVTAAVNYQNLNNEREVMAALKAFGKNIK